MAVKPLDGEPGGLLAGFIVDAVVGDTRNDDIFFRLIGTLESKLRMLAVIEMMVGNGGVDSGT